LAEPIANTSPLSYLHRAGILHVLPAIFGRVLVPSQVLTELSAGRERGYDLPEPLGLSWVDVRSVVPLASYFLGKRWGAMWMFAFPVAMLVAALYFSAARYDYTPRARALPSQVQPKPR
jgi:hypothetical protein